MRALPPCRTDHLQGHRRPGAPWVSLGDNRKERQQMTKQTNQPSAIALEIAGRWVVHDDDEGRIQGIGITRTSAMGSARAALGWDNGRWASGGYTIRPATRGEADTYADPGVVRAIDSALAPILAAKDERIAALEAELGFMSEAIHNASADDCSFWDGWLIDAHGNRIEACESLTRSARALLAEGGA